MLRLSQLMIAIGQGKAFRRTLTLTNFNSMATNKRLAIVTGSSSGIGKAIAERLLTEGWAVVGFDKSPSACIHPSFQAIDVDLSQSQAIAHALEHFQRLYTCPSAVVHAAGFMQAGPLETSKLEASEDMWRVHVAAISQIAQKLLPLMRVAQSGRIVLIGSRVAGGIANRSQYAASKAALISLARSWAAEVVANGVTVNVVSPAATETGMLADNQRHTVPPKLPPIGRLIQPNEIAATVSYLLSSNAAAITGQNIQICGGSSLDF
jgi:3-oxoacyl-[acyl-carrier protein] reductase